MASEMQLWFGVKSVSSSLGLRTNCYWYEASCYKPTILRSVPMLAPSYWCTVQCLIMVTPELRPEQVLRPVILVLVNPLV